MEEVRLTNMVVFSNKRKKLEEITGVFLKTA